MHLYKAWGISDFYTGDGKFFPYVEYPATEDLVALRKEVTNQTPIKLKDDTIDKALDSLNDGALIDSSDYTIMDFEKDFELVNYFWEIMIDYMKRVRTVQIDPPK